MPIVCSSLKILLVLPLNFFCFLASASLPVSGWECWSGLWGKFFLLWRLKSPILNAFPWFKVTFFPAAADRAGFKC